MSIWDPESVSICGRTYTVIMPSARDTLNIMPRLGDLEKYRGDDGILQLPDEVAIDLFIDLAAIGIEECVTGDILSARLPLAPLIQLGEAVLAKVMAAMEYAAEQKKTSNEVPTIEQHGH